MIRKRGCTYIYSHFQAISRNRILTVDSLVQFVTYPNCQRDSRRTRCVSRMFLGQAYGAIRGFAPVIGGQVHACQRSQRRGLN